MVVGSTHVPFILRNKDSEKSFADKRRNSFCRFVPLIVAGNKHDNKATSTATKQRNKATGRQQSNGASPKEQAEDK